MGQLFFMASIVFGLLALQASYRRRPLLAALALGVSSGAIVLAYLAGAS